MKLNLKTMLSLNLSQEDYIIIPIHYPYEDIFFTKSSDNKWTITYDSLQIGHP